MASKIEQHTVCEVLAVFTTNEGRSQLWESMGVGGILFTGSIRGTKEVLVTSGFLNYKC